MKKLAFTLLAMIFLLSACGQPAPIPVVEDVTSTPSLTPTSTATPLPTATLTASITPLPTISTFTPTFDVSTIVTVTPAPRAECPKIDLNIKPESYLPQKIEMGFFNVTDKILEYLNKGGDGRLLLERLNKIYPRVEYTGGYDYRDVTGDQVPEFLYIEFQLEGQPNVFSCRNGKFDRIDILSGDFPHHAYSMKFDDINANGIPEVIVIGAFGGSFVQFTIYIYEWDGKNFVIALRTNISAMRQFDIEDLGGNAIKEILISGDNPTCISCSNFLPQRQRIVTYGWNGEEFVEISNEFKSPEYRFQAIQDADAAVFVGKYTKAIRLYDEVITNGELKWWSPERLIYEQHIANPVYMLIATPSIIPTEDLTEYPRLAAYAYYRIMLLHLAQGQESDATATYNTLQQTFGNDSYAHPYVEMASAFWEAYQSTHRMYDGCAAAIQYAVEHPEILIPLGSDYHGAQSHIYMPADVCPFR